VSTLRSAIDKLCDFAPGGTHNMGPRVAIGRCPCNGVVRRCGRRSLTGAHIKRRADGETRTGAREPLRARRSVLDLPGLAQGIHRFVDGQEDCRFERAERTAATNRHRNRSHGHVVGGLP
jgi:hypothetical protein